MKYLTLSILPDAKISICWKIRWKVEQFSSDFPLLISHTPRFMFISISVGQECYALCSFIKGRKIGSKMHKQTLNSETIIENWKKKLFVDSLNIYCVSFVNSLLDWLILKNDEEDAIWFQLWIANIKKSHYVGYSLSLTISIDLPQIASFLNIWLEFLWILEMKTWTQWTTTKWKKWRRQLVNNTQKLLCCVIWSTIFFFLFAEVEHT